MCRSPWLPPCEGRTGGRHFGVIRHTERADGPFATVNGVRWTQTEDYSRWPLDPPLSDEGVASAQSLGGQVLDFYSECGEGVDVVVTSPYLRCLQTATTICDQLGQSVRMVVDNSLGEIYGPSVMGAAEPSVVIRPAEELPDAQLRSRVAPCKVVGEWPAWPEDASGARRRFAGRFLWWLRWACKAKRNFLIVTHADSVGAALRVMPSHAEQAVQSIDYGGRFMVSLRPESFRFSLQQLSPTERQQLESSPKKRLLEESEGTDEHPSAADWQVHSPKKRQLEEGSYVAVEPDCSDALEVHSPKKRQLEEGSYVAVEPGCSDALEAPQAWHVRTEGVRFTSTGEHRRAALAKRLGTLSLAECSPARELLDLLSPGGSLAAHAHKTGKILGVQEEGREWVNLPGAEGACTITSPGPSARMVLTDIKQSVLLQRRRCRAVNQER